jgi:chemotaxis protein methyltransferase CheR
VQTVLSDSTFRDIAGLMHGTIGLNLPPTKKALVASRLAPRIHRLGLEGYDAYLSLLHEERGDGELQVAIDLLTTNETYFFREPVHFEILRQHLGRPRERTPAAPVQVWSAASSCGDEAYTIAMVLSELQTLHRIGPGWSVLGTDISDRVLRAAQAAIYPAERMRHVPQALLRRHCLRGEGDCEGLVQLRPELCERVSFGQLNLCEDFEPLGPFDAIFLRNVLIYFDAETRRQVIERVVERLRPGGLFFIGMAEGRADLSQQLEAIGPGAFRKRKE